MLHMEHPEGVTRALAELIRERLADQGTSLRSTSLQTGIPLATLSRRLTGTSPFTIIELAHLATMFGVTVSRLANEAEVRMADGAA